MPGFFKIRKLRKDYAPHDASQPSALAIEELDIPLGGIVAIVGGSGSGKTTLLNLISGLETPDAGSSAGDHVLDLQLPDESKPRHLASSSFAQSKSAFPYDRVSYVFQQGYLLNQASISINLAMTRRAAGFKADDAALEGLIELAQLNESESDVDGKKQLSDRAVTLSGGQQQRINIARALGREPSLLFADELSSSLDPHKAEGVLTRLRAWIWDGHAQDGERTAVSRTMLWVTHDYQLASRFADAVVVLHRGGLAQGCNAPVELGTNRRASAADIRQWVQQGVVPADYADGGIQRQSPVADMVRSVPDNGGAKISRAQIALGNMGSGVALSWLEAFQQPYPSRWKTVNVFRRIVRPLLGFSGWARAMQLAAILALIMIITYGRQEVIRYFDEQLNDPTLRHVIVNQNMRALTASRINEQTLQSLSEEIAGLTSESLHNTNASASAYGRFTESVDVYPRGSEDINNGFVPEIMIGILDPGEPVYAEMDVHVIDPDDPSCEQNATAKPAELIPYADELVLIVSERYLTEARRMFDVDLCQTPWLDLWDVGDPRSFRIAGFMETPPADGYDYFDAVMQGDVWRTWLARMNKRQMNNLSRAAVYFNQQNYSGVIAALEERSFAFDQEIISKFSRLIGTSSQLRNTFLAITWLTLAVSAMVAAGLIWSYLVQNAKSIAVLRAHNAWFWPLLAAIPFQLLLTFAFALIYLMIGSVIWNFAVDQAFLLGWIDQLVGGSWAPGKISWSLVTPTLGWLAISFVVMIAVGLCCLLLWRLTHRRLAHELRQAY